MRIVLFVNGRAGLEAVKWLRQGDAEISGAVVHPDSNARLKEEVLSAAGLSRDHVVEAPELKTEAGVERLRSLGGDIGLSVYFGYILREPVISLFANGIVNVHPAYLPYNRGSYTNVWSIVDAAPAGVSVHYIDTGIDSGDIVAQRQVEVSPFDTGETLHARLEDECLRLLQETWPLIEDGTAPRKPQDASQGSSHKVKDVQQIDLIDLDRQYRARDLINVIRARTFPPYAGAYFEENGERVYMRLELLREDELSAQQVHGAGDEES